ncbi:MAG TPA: glycoside hydrolase family 15 protein, partial [Steroidobacteraceae bacterium]|nr:glycoside hydrolase family 15 protein [Steroidobacteraceae bacterium]
HSFFDERLASPGDLGLFERLAVLGERAVAVHDTADAGPWEFRGITAVHTFSAVMCWAGCDRLARIAGALGLADRMRTWTERASVIRKRVLEGAWSPSRQVFASSFGGTDVDATALLFPELGFVAPNDPRFLSTLRIIERELMEGHWLFRHRHADDFGTPATAFTICAFWYVNALALVGRVEEGRERFDQLLQHRTRLGLLSEDISLATRRLWGNFPQTYSMVGIINAAMRLSRPWESVA